MKLYTFYYDANDAKGYIEDFGDNLHEVQEKCKKSFGISLERLFLVNCYELTEDEYNHAKLRHAK